MQLDINGILDSIPHRYPMLLVDRVVDMVPGKSIHAIKNVSINEPFFPGHFPHHPVMPGVLILEALAQAAAVFSFADESGLKAKVSSCSTTSWGSMRLDFAVLLCRVTSLT